MPIYLMIGDERVSVSVPKRQVERMMPLHFRGYSTPKAGNFCRRNWANPYHVLKDLKPDILDEITEALAEGDFSTRSVEIELNHPVGWASTILLPKQLTELEPFRPNRHSTALRFRRDAKTAAPLTTLVTMVYQLRRGEDGLYMVVYSLYPGKDIGDLEGDISAEEKVAFFDWNHQGVPLAA